MTDERTKRALMRDDIIELALGLGYVAAREDAEWLILETAGDIIDDEQLYKGDDESVHSALLHEARRQLKSVDRLRAVVDAQPAPQSAPTESYVGRVYGSNSPENDVLILITAQAGTVVDCISNRGTKSTRPVSDLRERRHLPDHPMTTDPPREDGLGWQEGDTYVVGGDDVWKMRGNRTVARADCGITDGIIYMDVQQRLSFTPQWVPVEREKLPAEHWVSQLHPARTVTQTDLVTAQGTHGIGLEQLRDALEAAGWEKTDAPYEAWRKP